MSRSDPAAGSPDPFRLSLPGSAISSVLPVVPPVFPPILPAVDTVAYDGCCADYGCGAGDWGADDAYGAARAGRSAMSFSFCWYFCL